MTYRPGLEAFGVNSAIVRDSLRFDASFYNPRVIQAIDALEASDMEVLTLGEVTQDIYIPPRFKRIYVDADHGVPFLQGSHVVQVQPSDLKFISKTATKKLHKWIIEKGWILVTCSGTIGRVAITPPHWDGWAASQHILRIVPDEDACPSGYLAAFLSSPIGQAQLTAQIYGAVVDELTEEQAAAVLVPIPANDDQRRQVDTVNKQMLKAVADLSKSVRYARTAETTLVDLLPEYPVTIGDDEEESEAFEKFQALTEALVKVPKSEVSGT